MRLRDSIAGRRSRGHFSSPALLTASALAVGLEKPAIFRARFNTLDILTGCRVRYIHNLHTGLMHWEVTMPHRRKTILLKPRVHLRSLTICTYVCSHQAIFPTANTSKGCFIFKLSIKSHHREHPALLLSSSNTGKPPASPASSHSAWPHTSSHPPKPRNFRDQPSSPASHRSVSYRSC